MNEYNIYKYLSLSSLFTYCVSEDSPIPTHIYTTPNASQSLHLFNFYIILEYT